MSKTPIWFLDIDGVVNALSDGIPRGYRRTTAITMARGWRIVYSPGVVDFINAANREEFAEIRWLTTWEQDAHRELAPEVGLDTFPAYDMGDDSLSGWWKADVVAASIKQEGRPFVWTDDDLGTEEVDFLRDHADTLALPLATAPAVGLSNGDLTCIAAFLVERRIHSIIERDAQNFTREHVRDCMLGMGWRETQKPTEQLERWSSLELAVIRDHLGMADQDSKPGNTEA